MSEIKAPSTEAVNKTTEVVTTAKAAVYFYREIKSVLDKLKIKSPELEKAVKDFVDNLCAEKKIILICYLAR